MEPGLHGPSSSPVEIDLHGLRPKELILTDIHISSAVFAHHSTYVHIMLPSRNQEFLHRSGEAREAEEISKRTR